MKAIPFFLAVLSGLAFAAVPSASAASKTQQLTSPDQVPEGLEKSDWQSIRAAHEGWVHQFRVFEGGWQAVNPGQQWTTRFDGRGFLAKPKDADWQWGLEFKSYGFGDDQTQVSGTPAVRTDGQRLTYQWNETVQEWFVNDQRGLEHGFIITQRPATGESSSSSASPLSFTLATGGSLRPSLSADAQTVHFRDGFNAPVLNYSGLKVWDADGKILSSRFEADGENQFRLLVEEVGARYPLTIDPIAQQAYLKAGNNGAQTDDQFGRSVAVSGDTVVVGANQEDSSTTGANSTPNESASSSGAAYIFAGLGQPPTVASISPSLGSISGGTSVTINGTGFSGASGVTIGGVAATNVVVTNSTTITCTTPAGSVGNASVLVNTPVGTNGANTLFTYVNSPPTALALSANSIAENVAANSTVGTLSTTDPDAGSTFTYSLVSGSGSTDNAAFNISGSSLRITASPNFETKNSFAVRVRTTDQGGQFFEQGFIITITDGNDAPTFTGYSVSTPYQTAAPISFGKLLTRATDLEGHALTVTAAGPASTQGGTAVLQAGFILYTPANGFSGTDTFPVTITDALGASVVGTVTFSLQINTGIGTNAPVLTVMSGGRMGIGFHGIPGRTYQVQRSTNMSDWTTLTTITAAANGAVTFIDESPPPGSGLYRLRMP